MNRPRKSILKRTFVLASLVLAVLTSALWVRTLFIFDVANVRPGSNDFGIGLSTRPHQVGVGWGRRNPTTLRWWFASVNPGYDASDLWNGSNLWPDYFFASSGLSFIKIPVWMLVALFGAPPAIALWRRRHEARRGFDVLPRQSDEPAV